MITVPNGEGTADGGGVMDLHSYGYGKSNGSGTITCNSGWDIRVASGIGNHSCTGHAGGEDCGGPQCTGSGKGYNPGWGDGM